MSGKSGESGQEQKRDLFEDLKMFDGIKDLETIGRFAVTALPHAIKRALEAEAKLEEISKKYDSYFNASWDEAEKLTIDLDDAQAVNEQLMGLSQKVVEVWTLYCFDTTDGTDDEFDEVAGEKYLGKLTDAMEEFVQTVVSLSPGSEKMQMVKAVLTADQKLQQATKGALGCVECASARGQGKGFCDVHENELTKVEKELDDALIALEGGAVGTK